MLSPKLLAIGRGQEGLRMSKHSYHHGICRELMHATGSCSILVRLGVDQLRTECIYFHASKDDRLAHRCLPNCINPISVHAVSLNVSDTFSQESYLRSRGGQSSNNLLQSQRVSSANALDKPLTR